MVVAQIARLELLAPEERLDPEKLMQDLKAAGKHAVYLPDADAIVDHVAQGCQGGEVVVVFSNGGFGGIHANSSTAWDGDKTVGDALKSVLARDAVLHGGQARPCAAAGMHGGGGVGSHYRTLLLFTR